jgi:hypothetical protein
MEEGNYMQRAEGLEKLAGRVRCYPRSQKRDLGHPTLSSQLAEKQMQVLRLTTPKLKSAWGPVRSG